MLKSIGIFIITILDISCHSFFQIYVIEVVFTYQSIYFRLLNPVLRRLDENHDDKKKLITNNFEKFEVMNFYFSFFLVIFMHLLSNLYESDLNDLLIGKILII